MLAAIAAVVRKDLFNALRHPLFLILSVLVPLVIVAMFALVIHTSATNPVAVADHSEGPHSRTLVDELETIETPDGPYFRIVTTDPDEAEAAYDARHVPGIIRIPSEFDERVAAGDGASVELEVFNIDSDGTKNLELRLAHALRAFEQAQNGDDAVVISEAGVFPHDVPMRRYFGAALLMFAVTFLSMVNTGTLVAAEWEERTAKGVVLSPLGFGPLLLGKWTAAAALTAAGTALVAGVLIAGLDFPVAQLNVTSWTYIFVLFAYGAALGALLGVKLKNTLLLVPASAVISIAHLLLAGFESYIRGFAHDGVLLVLWQLGAWWPVAAVTDEIRLSVEGLATSGSPVGALAGLVVLTTLLSLLAVRHLREQLTFSQSM